jgi:bifunctional DNA-binding transcriptional regulator/antitoxin component of YhaV-PrlF toxin-antitoxin module
MTKVKRRRPTARLSRKNQLTLPVAALADAHVRPGDELRVEVEGDGRILLVRTGDPLDQFIGTVAGLSVATELEALRNEWAR